MTEEPKETEKSSDLIRNNLKIATRKIYQEILSRITMLFQNFPPKIMSEPMGRHGITIGSMSTLFDAADSQLFMPLDALKIKPDAEPDTQNIKDIKIAFETIILIQEKLKEIRAEYSADPEGHDHGIKKLRTPWADRQNQDRKKSIDSSVRHRDSSQPWRLNSSQKNLLDDMISRLTYYILAQAHLLGLSPKESRLKTLNSNDHETYRMDIPPIEGAGPPEPWAKKMAELKLSIPHAETDIFYTRS